MRRTAGRVAGEVDEIRQISERVFYDKFRSMQRSIFDEVDKKIQYGQTSVSIPLGGDTPADVGLGPADEGELNSAARADHVHHIDLSGTGGITITGESTGTIGVSWDGLAVQDNGTPVGSARTLNLLNFTSITQSGTIISATAGGGDSNIDFTGSSGITVTDSGSRSIDIAWDGVGIEEDGSSAGVVQTLDFRNANSVVVTGTTAIIYLPSGSGGIGVSGSATKKRMTWFVEPGEDWGSGTGQRAIYLVGASGSRGYSFGQPATMARLYADGYGTYDFWDSMLVRRWDATDESIDDVFSIDPLGAPTTNGFRRLETPVAGGYEEFAADDELLMLLLVYPANYDPQFYLNVILEYEEAATGVEGISIDSDASARQGLFNFADSATIGWTHTSGSDYSHELTASLDAGFPDLNDTPSSEPTGTGQWAFWSGSSWVYGQKASGSGGVWYWNGATIAYLPLSGTQPMVFGYSGSQFMWLAVSGSCGINPIPPP